jgi:hypothetical protein
MTVSQTSEGEELYVDRDEHEMLLACDTRIAVAPLDG